MTALQKSHCRSLSLAANRISEAIGQFERDIRDSSLSEEVKDYILHWQSSYIELSRVLAQEAQGE